MLLPPFWRGRQSRAPAGIRLDRFRAVLKAAHSLPAYRERLSVAGIASTDGLDAIVEVERTLASLEPMAWLEYTSLFATREPSWRKRPDSSETRSALLVPYAEARSGSASLKGMTDVAQDIYSDTGVARATSDLFRLSRSLSAPKSAQPRPDMAVVVFSGMDAGVLTEAQRNQIWDYYQVPLFEQLVGTDGNVIAMECEVHSGLHISPTAAILECIDGEILVTSLTDTAHPAIRICSGLTGEIEGAPCECGRVEARLLGLGRSAQGRAITAVA